MNERLKEIRKYTGLSQAKFGVELGVSRDSINNYEIGRVVPNDTFIQLLCSKFKINEDWLRNGTGEMFIQSPQTILDDLAQVHNLNEREKAIISAFLGLSPNGRAAVIEYIEKAAINLSSLSALKTRDEIIAERIAAADKKIAEEINIQK